MLAIIFWVFVVFSCALAKEKTTNQTEADKYAILWSVDMKLLIYPLINFFLSSCQDHFLFSCVLSFDNTRNLFAMFLHDIVSLNECKILKKVILDAFFTDILETHVAAWLAYKVILKCFSNIKDSSFRSTKMMVIINCSMNTS